MYRRAAAAGIIVAGLALIVTPIAYKLFSRSGPFEDITTAYRPIVRQDVTTQLKADVAGLEALPAQFQTQIAPAIAAALHVPADQLTLQFASQYPATVQAVTSAPAIAADLKRLVNLLDVERARFEQTDAIPTKSTTTRSIPWSLLASGVLALVCGASLLSGRSSEALLVALLGAALVVVPLVTSMPSKSAAADTLNAHLRSIMTQQQATTMQTELATLQAFATEVQTKAIPQLAAQLGVTPEQALAALPPLAAVAQGTPAALGRFSTLVRTFSANIDNYQSIRPVSFRALTWISIGAGIALAGSGIAGAASARASLEELGVERRRVFRKAHRAA